MLGLFKRKPKESPISVFYKPETDEIVYAKCRFGFVIYASTEEGKWTGIIFNVRRMLKDTVYLGVL